MGEAYITTRMILAMEPPPVPTHTNDSKVHALRKLIPLCGHTTEQQYRESSLPPQKKKRLKRKSGERKAVAFV